MSALNRMRLRCFKLGKEMPDEVEHEILMKILAKIIVQEKVHDDDAFELASKAYAEGFNGLVVMPDPDAGDELYHAGTKIFETTSKC
jgi:hypothetical protein